jgi:hypothetical protein
LVLLLKIDEIGEYEETLTLRSLLKKVRVLISKCSNKCEISDSTLNQEKRLTSSPSVRERIEVRVTS